ncbi:MAG: deaminase [Solirubrobacteraceae bacterium]|nr:deaminase [Solirubrobacteraceae bacterium]
MSDTVVLYVPVLHEGYRRFLAAHATGKPVHVIGRELHADYRPLAKDIRALEPALVRDAIASWGIASTVEVLDEAGARALAETRSSLTLPSEDVSYAVVERWFARSEVTYDTAFLRWDKRKSVELLVPGARPVSDADEAFAGLAAAAEAQAGGSIDWWRQVGAAIRFADGTVAAAHNALNPTPGAAYAVGDPRSNFFKGVHLELSLATHAEAKLIADAAREGRATAGATLYVTDFPCPPCAKLIAGAGIERVYFRTGYAVLDGEDVLRDAGVELIDVSAVLAADTPTD